MFNIVTLITKLIGAVLVVLMIIPTMVQAFVFWVYNLGGGEKDLFLKYDPILFIVWAYIRKFDETYIDNGNIFD